MTGFSRYVALGDSQTEGLWDRDAAGALVGFADRLAAHLDALHPGLTYANLAVRGRRIADVLDDQLPSALSMRPDLVTICIGMNDVTRPGRSFGAALADLEAVYAKLAASGATVVTTMFPDITAILPVGRLVAGRVRRINGVIESSAQRYGFRLVDLFAAESMREPDTWAADRVPDRRRDTGCSPRRRPRPSDCPAATTAGPRQAWVWSNRRSGPAPPRRCRGHATCWSRICGAICGVFRAVRDSSRAVRCWRR